jgi:competence protein ComEC
MASTYSELVFVRLVVPFIVGILLFYNIPSIAMLVTLSGLLFILLAGLAYLNWCYSQLNGAKIKPYLTVCFYLLPLTFGGWTTLLHKELLRTNHFSKHHAKYLEVVINDEPQIRGNTLRFQSKIIRAINSTDYKAVEGHLMISINIKEKQLNLKYGDQLFIPARFDSIASPRNPYQFDTKKWYSQQNIYHQAYLQPEQIIVQKSQQGNPVIDWAFYIRKRQVLLFRRLIKEDEAYAVASTLILGYRAELTEETLMAYSKTGTIHALSVSGMHVGLIYLIINFLLDFLDKWKSGRLIKLVLSIILIWLYALIAGFAPSVLRSALMLSVFIIGHTFKRNKNSYNLLAFSAFFILLYNPLLIYDVGFQLSYLSVLGLIYLQPYIYAWFSFKYAWADKLWGFIALSLAAQIATFPLATYYFHQFPLYFLISNLYILLPVSLIMYLGLLITLCPVDFLSPGFEWLLRFTNNGLKWIADLPYATITKIWFSNMEVLLLSTSTLFFCFAFSRINKRMLFISLSCLALFFSSLAIHQYQKSNQRKIIFFSVQKGTVIAFIDKTQAWVFSALEPDSKSIKYYVQPSLDQAGVSSVTYVKPHKVLSQPQLQMEQHQIRFYKYDILIVDSCFNDKTIVKNVKSDALIIRKNANLDLEILSNNIDTKMVFLDADLMTYRAERYKNVAKQFKLSIYDLKIKKAYLINLNQSL